MTHVDDTLARLTRNIDIAHVTIADSGRRVRRMGLEASSRACADEADGIAIHVQSTELQGHLREINQASGALETSMKTFCACAGALAEAGSMLIALENELNSLAGGDATVVGDAVR